MLINYLIKATPKSCALLVLLVMILGGCTKENTIGEEAPQSSFNLSVDLDDLDVRRTCENDGSSGRADLYHTFRILKSTADDPFNQSELYESDDILIQIGLNERIETTSLVSSFSYSPVDGDRLTLVIYIEERDPGKVQVWDALRYEIQYSAAANCWSELNNDTCLFQNIKSVKEVQSRFGNGSRPGSPCLVNYEWSIYVQEQ